MKAASETALNQFAQITGKPLSVFDGIPLQ
jgi:hypothetical protein